MGSCPSKNLPQKDSSQIIKKLESILKAHRIIGLKSYRVRRDTVLHHNNEVFVKSTLSRNVHTAKELKKKMIAVTKHSDVVANRKKILRHDDIVITVYKHYSYDLHHAIHSSTVHAEHLQIYLFSLITNINNLHARNMAHTDLKPSNVLCDYVRLTTRLCDLENCFIQNHPFTYKGGSLFYKPCSQRFDALMKRKCSLLKKMQLLDLYAFGCIVRQSLQSLTRNKRFWKNVSFYFCETCLQPSFTRGRAKDIRHIASYHFVHLPISCCA